MTPGNEHQILIKASSIQLEGLEKTYEEQLNALSKPCDPDKIVTTARIGKQQCLDAEAALIDLQLNVLDHYPSDLHKAWLKQHQECYREDAEKILRALAIQYQHLLEQADVVYVEKGEGILIALPNLAAKQKELLRFEQANRVDFFKVLLEWVLPPTPQEAFSCYQKLRQQKIKTVLSPEQREQLQKKCTQAIRAYEEWQTHLTSMLKKELAALRQQKDLHKCYGLFLQGDLTRLKTSLAEQAIAAGYFSLVSKGFLGLDKIKVPDLTRFVAEKRPNALHLACQAGALDLIQYLLTELKLSALTLSTRALEPHSDGYYPLHFAVMKPTPQTQAVLDYVAPYYQKDLVNMRGKLNRTPLNTAAFFGNLLGVNWLLAHGADPNALEGGHKLRGNTPLHNAAYSNSPAVITALLKAGANPRIKTRSGKTALMEAMEHGNIAAVQAFWEQGLWLSQEDYQELPQILQSASTPKQLHYLQRRCLAVPQLQASINKKLIVLPPETSLNTLRQQRLAQAYEAAASRQQDLLKALNEQHAKLVDPLALEELELRCQLQLILLQLQYLEQYGSCSAMVVEQQRTHWQVAYEEEAQQLLRDLVNDMYRPLLEAREGVCQAGQFTALEAKETKIEELARFEQHLKQEILSDHLRFALPKTMTEAEKLITLKKFESQQKERDCECCLEARTGHNTFFLNEYERHQQQAKYLDYQKKRLGFEKTSLQDPEVTWEPYALFRQENIQMLKEQLRAYVVEVLEPSDDLVGDFVKTRLPSALHVACAEGNLPLVRYLIETFGVEQKANGKGYYPIHCAASHERQSDQNVALLHYLQKNGADINAPGPHGRTPLAVAAIYGNELGAAWLLAQPGIIANCAETAEVEKSTALHHASAGGFASIVDQLLQHGADPTALNSEGETALLEAFRYGQVGVMQVFWRQGIWLSQTELKQVQVLLEQPLAEEHAPLRDLQAYGLRLAALESARALEQLKKVFPDSWEEQQDQLSAPVGSAQAISSAQPTLLLSGGPGVHQEPLIAPARPGDSQNHDLNQRKNKGC